MNPNDHLGTGFANLDSKWLSGMMLADSRSAGRLRIRNFLRL
jgi:hypothetical protein